MTTQRTLRSALGVARRTTTLTSLRPRLSQSIAPFRAAAAASPPHRQISTASPTQTAATSPSTLPLFSGMSEEGLTETQLDVRHSITSICSQYPDSYWLDCERNHRYPHELFNSLVSGGWIGLCIPEEYGGAGLGAREALVMLQTIAESGASVAGAQSIHANVYPVLPIIAYGTEEQKKEWLPKIAKGEIRTCFGVTEANNGSETLKLQTSAKRDGDKYVVNGQKVWTSSAQEASHCVLLVRTSPPTSNSRSSGLSLLFAPLRDAPNTDPSTAASSLRPGVTMHPMSKMGGNHIDANEVWYEDFSVPSNHVIGQEGGGWKVVLHGMNFERILLAGEALGTGYAALTKAVHYANERVLFGKPIGAMQAIQHPLAKAYVELDAARALAYEAAAAYDSGVSAEAVGAKANAAKYFCAEASYRACETAMMTMGGMGYEKSNHVERYLRESFIPRMAPVSREMVLNFVGSRVLGLPKSY